MSWGELSKVKYANNDVSIHIVSERGLSVLWSLQWLNLYPEFAMALIIATGEEQLGVSNTDTWPFSVSDELNENE